MSLSADTLAYLLTKGVKPEDLVDVVRAIERDPGVTRVTSVTANSRSNNAERQARHRVKQKAKAVTGGVTSNVTHNAPDPSPSSPAPSLPLETPPTPTPIIPSPPSLRSVSVRAREAEKLFDEQFWPTYPRREGGNPKDPARKKFANLVVAGVDPAVIIEGLAKYAQAVIHENPRFIAQAVTWLNQRRWEDDHRTVPPKPPPKSYSRGNGLSEALDILRQRDAENGQRSQENEPDPRGSEGRDQGAGRGEDDLPFEARRESHGRTLDLVAVSSGWH